MCYLDQGIYALRLDSIACAKQLSVARRYSFSGGAIDAQA